MSFASVIERLQKIENPYPGLRPFQTNESHLFFGRDLQVAELVSRLENNRFLAVLGVSGSGKSSLVRAGLIPALERGHVSEAGRRWRTIITRPAGAPFESLAADLGQAGLDASRLRQSSHGLIQIAEQLPREESLLIVVDQFEELFRYKESQPATEEARRTHDRLAADAAEFVHLLLAATRHHPPVYIVLTMRSDYLGECAEFRDLPETLNDCQYLVPRMTRQQRKEAIEGPLGKMEIAPSLVQRMLNDAGDEPDQLPVLQHALMRTWNQWRKNAPDRKRRIEIRDYEDIGGFEGAVNQHADELLAGASREITECVFKRLTARGRGNRERRDPARLAELWAVCGAVTPEQQAQVTAVVDHFRRGDATFLSPLVGSIGPGTFIDITHESVIRLWKKLRDVWLREEHSSAKALIELSDRAGKWQAKGAELLAGRDLIAADVWDRHRNKTSAWALHYLDEATLHSVLEFINASRGKDQRRVLVRRGQWIAALVLIFGAFGWVWYDSLAKARIAAAEAEKDTRNYREAAEDAIIASQHQLYAIQTQLVGERPDFNLPGAGPSALAARPRAYIQVRAEAETDRVLKHLRPLLERAGLTVPEPEVLPTGPSANEVRFYRETEMAQAEQIVGIVQQAGFGHTVARILSGYDSTRVRAQHFEIWLAPGDLVRTLVKQMDDPIPSVRVSAGGLLALDHRADPLAIGLVLDSLSGQNFDALSAQGRINALYFLSRSELSAWTDDHKKLAGDAIQRIKARAGGVAALGQQTSQELKDLEEKLIP